MIRRVNVRLMRAVVKAALLFILLLWVHVILCITCAILRRYTIQGYMPLTASFLLPTTPIFKSFCSNSVSGMHWQSFGCTQTNPWTSCSNPYGASVTSCIIFNNICVPHFTPMNSRTKQHNDRGGKWLSMLLAIERKSHDLPCSQRPSISTSTSFMPWAIMST